MIIFNSNTLPQGIPLIGDYKNLLKTDLFLGMESFSNTFLKTHAKALKNYRWATDPFHQWSRQWEYPFAYSYIQQYVISNSKFVHTNDKIRILDAGSGCTFFPYCLSHKHPNCKVYCCDHDPSLAPIFIKITNKQMNANVEFDVYDLEKLRYKNNFFDIIYCISTLEHTHNREDIIKQFKRVLKPNGLVIVTFDISLDNKAAIAIDIAENLLNKLSNEFKVTNSNNFREVLIGIQNPDIFTTEFARKYEKKLLPWKLTWVSFLGQLLRLKLPKRPFFILTVFCGVWRKIK